MQQTNRQIAESIRALAKAKGVTVKQTLEDCRINRNFIYDLEHGGSSPSVDKISRIAEYFGTSTAKLLGNADGEIAAFLSLYNRLSEADRKALRDYMLKLLDED